MYFSRKGLSLYRKKNKILTINLRTPAEYKQAKQMKILKTNTTTYEVRQNEDGTLTILWQKRPIQRAGELIRNLGGIDAVLARCQEYTEEEWQSELDSKKAARKAKEEVQKRREEARHLKCKEDYDAVFGGGDVVEATYENVCILLRYLHGINHGLWRNLPKMTIEYRCGQYDCDFVTATAINLDKPIDVDGEMISKFCIGGKNGYMSGYTKILFE